jgi:hypothetical protein
MSSERHGVVGATWGTAVKATAHCLAGCVFGYSFTLIAVVRAGLGLAAALQVALAADTVSIAVMELVDNAIIALTPGAMDAHLTDGLFWGALLGGFAVAFLITTPVNRWMIGRGRGHAVVHAHH